MHGDLAANGLLKAPFGRLLGGHFPTADEPSSEPIEETQEKYWNHVDRQGNQQTLKRCHTGREYGPPTGPCSRPGRRQ
jgi:hypothetical protein